jgi:hypothetical protein
MVISLSTAQNLLDRAMHLSDRCDEFLARRDQRQADKAARRADRARRDAEGPDPAQQAVMASDPLARPTQPNRALEPRDLPEHPWYDDELLASERRELRQGALSKGVH